MLNNNALGDETVTVEDAAKMLGFTSRSITQKLRDHELVGFKTGRRWRIPKSSIEAYLKSVQPSGVDPPSVQQLHRSLLEASQARHVSGLLEHLGTLRAGLDYLNQPNEFERWLRGPNSELKSPNFKRVTLRGIEQHLAETGTIAAWQKWVGSTTNLLELQRSVFELMRRLGEAEFNAPTLSRDPESGGRLTEGFAAIGLAFARTYDDPAEAARDARVTCQDGELRYNSSYILSTGTGLTDAEAMDRFAIVIEKVVASEQARAMRSGLGRYSETTRKFEDELDGIELTQSMPGSCDWCPNQ